MPELGCTLMAASVQRALSPCWLQPLLDLHWDKAHVNPASCLLPAC